ncbi:charged multivesicular body protein 1-like [Papaver somniferum]|uniref:charged multivesicular body protein 1-like n=1 Tax=Papaver somniferum TaxID=3469 RepID=UPI000E6FC13E|nr:charged multivesicular body protein 1-like [Papaver somniferum]
MASSVEKMESKTEALRSLSENMRKLADECEKEIGPEIRKITGAMKEGNTKQVKKHRNNMNGIRHEVLNYRRISMRIDSMVDYFDNEPEQSRMIPEIVQSMSSSLAAKNPKKLLKAMNKIEKRYFDEEVVAKFKYSAATFMSEDETKTQSWWSDIFSLRNIHQAAVLQMWCY